MPILYIRIKGENWEIHELNEKININGNNYLVKKFSNNILNSIINDGITVKCVLFDSCII